jgi:hypothetical protein
LQANSDRRHAQPRSDGLPRNVDLVNHDVGGHHTGQSHQVVEHAAHRDPVAVHELQPETFASQAAEVCLHSLPGLAIVDHLVRSVVKRDDLIAVRRSQRGRPCRAREHDFVPAHGQSQRQRRERLDITTAAMSDQQYLHDDAPAISNCSVISLASTSASSWLKNRDVRT